MRRAVFAVPGDLSAPTGGYTYAREVLRRLPTLTYLPLPDPERLAAIPVGTPVLIDGLALGTMTTSCLDRIQAPIVGLVHHPLYLESGLMLAEQQRLRDSERVALHRCARVIATSQSTASLLVRNFGVPEDRLAVAEPGTYRVERSLRTGAPLHLLAVGAVVPRKGYEVLAQALDGLKHLPWRLTIAGSTERHPNAVQRLRAAIVRYGLADRIMLTGAVPAAALNRLFAGADVFVTASLHEGYGMAVAEAMAYGLPLVATTAGALAETILPGAALTCPPNDVSALREALHRMLTDTACRDACADASWQAGQALPTWDETAQQVAAVLDALC